MSSTSIYLDPSFSSSLTQYAGGSVSLETLVWQRFVVTYDIDVSKSLTDTELTQFKTFLELYESLGLTTSALSGTATPPSTSNYDACYNEIASSPYLNWICGSTTLAGLALRDIWNGFLQKYDIDSNLVSTIDFSALFSTYIKSLEQTASNYKPSLSTAEVSPEQDLQIALWNRFLTIYGYSATQQSTATMRTQFSQFLQQYELWGIDVTTLNSSTSLPSGDGSEFFLNCLNSFYGQYGTQELTDLWNRFLQTQGLTSNPTDLSSLQKPFISFLKNLMSNKASFEAATSISPADQEQRQLFGTLMDSLANMLAVTEQVVVTNAAALKIYGAWQEQLTQQMTRTSSLSALSSLALEGKSTTGALSGSDVSLTTIQIPTGDPVTVDSTTDETTYWDLDKFTLGYNLTSMKEVIQWAYGQLRDGSSTSVSLTPGAGGTYTFSLVQGPDGSSSIQVSILGPAGDTSSASVKYTSSAEEYMLADGSGSSPSLDTSDDWVTAISHTFCTAMSSLTASITKLRGTSVTTTNTDGTTTVTTTYVLGLTGHYTGNSTYYTDTDTGTQALDTSESQNRQEQNAILQQYIAQVRARRAVVQNASTNIQATLQTAQTSINKIASLWTSILQAIATILQSLYQKS